MQAEGTWVEVGRVPFTWGKAEAILAPGLCLSRVKARGGKARGDRVPVGRLVRPLFREEDARERGFEGPPQREGRREPTIPRC